MRTGQVVEAGDRRAVWAALLLLGRRTLRLRGGILPVQPRHLSLADQVRQVQLLLLVCDNRSGL